MSVQPTSELARVFLLVFALNNKNSFHDLENFYRFVLRAKDVDVETRSAFVLVGNKVDLEDQREVTQQEATRFAEKIGASAYVETSAASGANIHDVFAEVVRAIIKHRKAKSPKKHSEGKRHTRHTQSMNINETEVPEETQEQQQQQSQPQQPQQPPQMKSISKKKLAELADSKISKSQPYLSGNAAAKAEKRLSKSRRHSTSLSSKERLPRGGSNGHNHNNNDTEEAKPRCSIQ